MNLFGRVYKSINAKWFFDKHMFRFGVFATLSVATAYFIGVTFNNFLDPTIAGVIALATMRPTFHDAIKEGFIQIAGTISGAALGIIMTAWFGFNILTLSALVMITFFLAWVLKLGQEGAVAIGITVIVVAGPLSDNIKAVEGRLLGVVLGAFVALIYSYFVLQGKPHERALNEGIRQQRLIANILKDVGIKITNGYAANAEMGLWMKKTSSAIDVLNSIKEDAKSAVEGSSWSPMLKKEDTEKVLLQIEMAELTASSVYSIVIDLQRHFGKDAKIPEGTRTSLGEAISKTAEIIFLQAEQAVTNPSIKLATGEKEILIVKKKRAANKLKENTDTQILILGGSILSDATKIRDILSE